MRTRQYSSVEYTAAGLATLTRQAGEFYVHKVFPVNTATDISGFFGLDIHRYFMACKSLEQLAGMMVILTEQAAYPLLLQTSHEIDKLMATQIPLEKKQLSALVKILPLFIWCSPLALASLGNYVRSLDAQIHCHQTVLNHFNSMWTWVEKTEVTYVVDGDTIYVAEYPDVAIRLEGIDCPEIWHEGDGDPDDPKWDAGNAAKEFTETELLGKEVKLRARTERDIYDRIIAKVFYPGDKNFSWQIMAAGHAEMMLSTWW